MRQPLIKRIHIIRLGRLLDMLYRPAEIAEEIGVSPDTICRSYIPAGMPYNRDGKGNIWIHGPAFVAWAKETAAKKKADRKGLPDGQAWCMRCNQPVPMIEPTVRSFNRTVELLQSHCPHCGTLVNRGRARQHAPSSEGGSHD